MHIFRSRSWLRGSEVDAINIDELSTAGFRHRQRTVREHSAGGLIIDGLDDNVQVAALIRTTNRDGHARWSVPKGHIEVGETPEQAAVREINEETGAYGSVLAPLGVNKYSFRAQDRTVHKTVHHYLLRFIEGELCADDHEVEDVAWVPLDEVPARLTHRNERELGRLAAHLVSVLITQGPAALPPLPNSAPRRRHQTHSIADRAHLKGPTRHAI